MRISARHLLGWKAPKGALRQHVCDIPEGGERAFKERAKRLRVSI